MAILFTFHAPEGKTSISDHPLFMATMMKTQYFKYTTENSIEFQLVKYL